MGFKHTKQLCVRAFFCSFHESWFSEIETLLQWEGTLYWFKQFITIFRLLVDTTVFRPSSSVWPQEDNVNKPSEYRYELVKPIESPFSLKRSLYFRNSKWPRSRLHLRTYEFRLFYQNGAIILERNLPKINFKLYLFKTARVICGKDEPYHKAKSWSADLYMQGCFYKNSFNGSKQLLSLKLAERGLKLVVNARFNM